MTDTDTATPTDTTIDFAPLLALRDEAERSAAALAEVAPIVAEARRVLGEVERAGRRIDRQIRAALGDDTSKPSPLNDVEELIFQIPAFNALYDALHTGALDAELAEMRHRIEDGELEIVLPTTG